MPIESLRKKVNTIKMLTKLKKRKRLKTHGFRSRNAKVLSRRRAKGRKKLTVSIHSK